MGGFNTSVPQPSPVALDIRPPQVQSPLETLAQMQAVKAQQQEAQTRQLQQQALTMENQQRQIELQDQQTMRQAWMQANGDLDKTLTNYQKLGGSPKGAFALQQQVTQMKEAKAKLTADELANQNLKNDQIEALLQPVMAEQDPAKQQALWNNALSSAVSKGLLTADEASQHPYQGPDGVQLYAKGLETEKWLNAQAAQTRANAQASEADTAAKKFKAEQPGIEAESTLKAASAAALKTMTDADWQQRLDTTVPDKNSPLYQRTRAAVDFYRKKGDLKGAAEAIDKAGDQLGKTESAVATAKATAPIKIDVAAATQQAGAKAAESSGGLDLMAEQALNGTFSSRNPALMSKVYGRAAELAKERGLSNQQVLMERNAAHANQAALTSLTKNYETLKPFEEMALKNSQILEQKSQDVADLGAPFLNTPVRSLQSKFAGNAKVTAFIAAMQPVQADFARILNSPNASGVLSDDARHEMQQAISPGATPSQIKAALDVFRQDAANRHATYDAAVKDLQGRTVVGNAGEKTAQNNGGGIKTINTKAEYDALPKGSKYIDQQDGKTYTKR